MVVVALVAVGIAGWKAREHWAECSRRGAELRASIADEKKFLAEERQYDLEDEAFAHETMQLASLRESLVKLTSAKATQHAEPAEEIKIYDRMMTSLRNQQKGLKKLHQRIETLTAAMERVAEKYQYAAWRPWVDLRPIRAEDKKVENQLLEIAMTDDPQEEAEYDDLESLLKKVDKMTDLAAPPSPTPAEDSPAPKDFGSHAAKKHAAPFR